MGKKSYEAIKGIMITNGGDENDDFVFYRLACSCSNEDCDAHLHLKYDKELNDVTLMICKNLYSEALIGEYEKSNANIKYYNFKEQFEEKKITRLEIIFRWFEIMFIHEVNSWWQRLRKAFQVLTSDRVKMEAATIFIDPKHLDNFIYALKDGKAMIKKNGIKKEENKEKEVIIDDDDKDEELGMC